METAAHLVMLIRRRRPVMMWGYWWAYCSHRSHKRGLRCWRWKFYDGYCIRHNETCYADCPEGEK